MLYYPVLYSLKCRSLLESIPRTFKATTIKFKGHTVHASKDEPQYELKSDTNDHIAMHKG